jgi:predicted transcriptional regulator
MLASELVVEVQALRSQGWTVSAIARHLGVTPVTVRRYLSGEQTPGVRARLAPDPFARVRRSDSQVCSSTIDAIFDRFAVGGGIELKVDRPHHLRGS